MTRKSNSKHTASKERLREIAMDIEDYVEIATRSAIARSDMDMENLHVDDVTVAGVAMADCSDE